MSTTKVVLLSIFLFLGMVLPGIFMQPESSLEVWNINESEFPENNSRAQERLTFLLNYAILAPSSHNSQPWKFNVSDEGIQVFADQSRWLSVADPDKREMYISLGAALENLIISAEHFGYNCTISYFPVETDLVAEVFLKEGTKASPNPALFEAITTRHTNRNPYQMRAISGVELDDLYRYSSLPDVAVFLSQDPDTNKAFRDLVVEADGTLYSDINYRSELGRWLGRGVMGPRGAKAKLAQLAVVFLNVGPAETQKDSDLINSTPCIGFISTAENNSLSSLQAGRALERLWLAAASQGLGLHPMSQPLEVRQMRERLAALLPSESEKRMVQQTFRLGYDGSEGEHSNRRPLEDVFMKA
ncbi:MAG: nitroreductase family protein [Methanothrix sp.]